MTQEEKQLLFKDLCARLPYDVMVNCESNIYILNEIDPSCKNIGYITVRIQDVERLMCAKSVIIENIKPYLRPMSSMTEDEFGFLQEHLPYDFTRIYSGKFDLIDDIHLSNSVSIDDMAFLLDCLNKWHLDYRGLIPMGLALEAPKDMYNTKTE